MISKTPSTVLRRCVRLNVVAKAGSAACVKTPCVGVKIDWISTHVWGGAAGLTGVEQDRADRRRLFPWRVNEEESVQSRATNDGSMAVLHAYVVHQ